MHTGKTTNILANIVSTEDEITGIKLYISHKKILVCDNKGNLKTNHIPTGMPYTVNNGHIQEIT
jgi:hypothetical protein